MSYELVLTPVNGYCPPDTFAVTVTDASDLDLTDIAAFNYIVFDANSAAQDFEGGSIPINDAVQFTAAGGNTGYILYIPLATCNLTYNYVVVRAALVDGSVTDYSADALQIHTPPCAPVIIAAHVSEDISNNLVPVIFIEAMTLDPSDTYITSFNAAFQTEDISTNEISVFVDSGLTHSILADEPLVWYITDPTRYLTEGQVYHVAVQAVNSWGAYSTTSCLSNTATLVTVPGLLPPTNVTATSLCDGAIVLSWVPPIDVTLQDYTGYQIYYWDVADGSANPSGPINVAGGETSTYVMVQDVIPFVGGHSYEFYLVSVGTPWPPSEPSNIAGPAISVETPNDVTGVLLASGNEQATVRFNNPAWSEGLEGNSFLISIVQDNGVIGQSGDDVIIASQTKQYNDASDAVYTCTFGGLENGTYYYFLITYFASVLDASAECQEVSSTVRTSDIVPSGLPLIYDISNNNCTTTYTVCSNDIGAPGIRQRAIIEVVHYTNLTNFTEPIFEIQWSQEDYPDSSATPVQFNVLPPASFFIVPGEGITYQVTIALTATPTYVDIQELDPTDGSIITVRYYPLAQSLTYNISITPQDDSNDCINSIRVFASNTTGMSSNGTNIYYSA